MAKPESNDNEKLISIVLPCYNEEGTVKLCVTEALEAIKECLGEDKTELGEVLVVDNASTDRSAQIASENGARVVREDNPGYGNALRRGITEAEGKVIMMADCDTTYVFKDFVKMYHMLSEEDYDMVIGDRFAGDMEKGAMPLSHHIGVRFLSWSARVRFHSDVRDFHCGIRGLTKEARSKVVYNTEGMEFATEMIGKAEMAGLKIGQMPAGLNKSFIPRKPKLRTIPDGFRHLKYIMTK